LLIGVTLAAILSGATNLRAIGQWAQTIQGPIATLLGLGARRPDESTIRRVLARLDPQLLGQLVGSWTRLRSGQLSGRTVISFDGKTVRGAKAGGHHAPHLVAGLLHGDDTVIAQAEVDSKSNEIPCLKELLKCLVIAGCLIIADAMHTQFATAMQILAQQGHYLFTVKANQPTMMRLCANLPWNNCPRRSFKDGSHGRRVTRTITVLSPPAGYLDFPGVNQIARLTRTRTVQGKKTKETVYIICSLPAHLASPDQITYWIQHHWAIENRLHYVRDTTFGEDGSTCRVGNLPHVMASLRNLTINLIRLAGYRFITDALRHHAWRPDSVILLLQSQHT